jgi:hypothetical protein
MAKQKTRGSLKSKIYGITETLKVAVKTSRNYPALKKDVLDIIGHLENTYLVDKPTPPEEPKPRITRHLNG